MLDCISALAQHVGDSLHLLEAMGGIVGKLLGPSPLSTAVLDCIVAASGAVNSFSSKASDACTHCCPQRVCIAVQLLKHLGARMQLPQSTASCNECNRPQPGAQGCNTWHVHAELSLRCTHTEHQLLVVRLMLQSHERAWHQGLLWASKVCC